MDYYVNEYSLRGQFQNVYEFFDSLREYTFPVLNRVKQEAGSLIWKKDTLWNCSVCPDYTLREIQHGRNERSPEMAKLKVLLRDLCWNQPMWHEDARDCVSILEYGFDQEYSDKFLRQNCFTRAWENEGTIISFWHICYQTKRLPFLIAVNEKSYRVELDNIYSIKWWERPQEIKKWKIDDKYLVEVRGKEFDYHPPHFHVSSSDYQAVIHLKTGNIYRGSRETMPANFLRDVKSWYEEHKSELEQAWDLLHPSVTYDV